MSNLRGWMIYSLILFSIICFAGCEPITEISGKSPKSISFYLHIESDTKAQNIKTKYGVSFENVNGLYIYGTKEFTHVDNADLQQCNVKFSGLIDYFTPVILTESNLLVISADIPYNALPKKIADKVDKKKYESLIKGEFLKFEVEKAYVLIEK